MSAEDRGPIAFICNCLVSSNRASLLNEATSLREAKQERPALGKGDNHVPQICIDRGCSRCSRRSGSVAHGSVSPAWSRWRPPRWASWLAWRPSWRSSRWPRLGPPSSSPRLVRRSALLRWRRGLHRAPRGADALRTAPAHHQSLLLIGSGKLGRAWQCRARLSYFAAHPNARGAKMRGSFTMFGPTPFPP